MTSGAGTSPVLVLARFAAPLFLVLLNVSSFVQQIVIGVILIAAVAVDRFAQERRLA